MFGLSKTKVEEDVGEKKKKRRGEREEEKEEGGEKRHKEEDKINLLQDKNLEDDEFFNNLS